MLNWDLSSPLNSGISAGGTLMSMQQEQHTSLWKHNMNADSVNIKTELIEPHSMHPNKTPPQIPIRSLSPMMSTPTTMDQLLEQIPSSFRQLGVFNPLTPPGYSGLIFPPLLNSHHKQTLKQLTPSKLQNLLKMGSNSISNEEMTENGSSMTPPMDVTPPKSPRENSMNDQTPEKEENLLNNMDARSDSLESYDEDSDDYGDEETQFPNDKSKSKSKRKSSNGKPKQYKCKQCKLVCVTKAEFWDHTRSHIKPEKMLQCPKCPFVTEYKHHLEYHLRNHSRSKPFQCPKCNYSCVNKSMLNSHLKSHSNVFQYRCADCNYATKYCHSLKLHLRKYTHKPDIVLNLDGTPNPLPIIDVYGTRRGPKSKSTTAKLLEEISRNSTVQNQRSQLSPPLTPSTSTANNNNSVAQQQTNGANKTPIPNPPNLLPNALMANMLQNVGGNISLFPYLNLNLQMLAAHQQQQQQQQSENSKNSHLFSNEYDNHNFANDKNSPITEEGDVIDDLSSLDSEDMNMENEQFDLQKNSAVSTTTLKGTAMDHQDLTQEENSSCSNQPPQSPVSSNTNSNNNKITTTSGNMFECKFCGIFFKDNILYTIHMGYHGYNDVFKCNSCGEKCDDHVQFFLHIAKYPHS